jgi:two-component system phosphate regulon sensor histidine kinase PhoR
VEESTILKAIAKEMRSGVVVLNRDKKIRYANPFFEESFALDGELKGKSLDEFISSKRLLLAVDAFASTSEVPAAQIEIVERERVFNVRMVPTKEGETVNLLLFVSDVTEEKLLESIKKDFVANVSHELRTPLASIKGYSETLLDGGLDDRKTLEDFLRIIDKHATRMSRLIDDLLILSRLESHQIQMVAEPLDISELASSIVEGFSKQAKDKGIELTLSASDDMPQMAGDRDRIEQVMTNLLDNAIKYTPADGKVDVSLFVDDGEIRLDVRDTGLGIPEEDISRIFERFYRVDKARSRELGGTGLGLAIVKHIVQGLGGRVWVESKLGGGSTFSFALRAAS